LALKNRRGELTQADILIAEAGFRRFVAGRTRVANIAAEDFYRAAELCAAGVGLRAGDALHLAIAERLRLTVCTLDRGMWSAAQTLCLPVETF
jgi:predicted nucleic acid-binding protein